MEQREKKRLRLGDTEGPAFGSAANTRVTEAPCASPTVVESIIASSADHEAVSEKMPDAPTSVSSEASRTPKTSTWQGWAEIENDPIVFNIMLREWGVRGVQVNEVVPLDAIFDSSPTSTFGLIFLSRYSPNTKKKQDIEVSHNLWFANQTSTYSCATVALMNIISNVEYINLGQEISQFIAATSHMPPMEKGLALDSFEHVRKVHNSFATLIDMKSVDRRLREDARAFAARRKRQKTKKTSTKTAKPRKGKSHLPKRKALVDDDGEDNDEVTDDQDEESGFHFTAYVPAHNHLWRLDGLQREPESLGVLSGSGSGGNWLDMAVAELSARWQSAADSNIEFSLLSLVAAPTTTEEEEGGKHAGARAQEQELELELDAQADRLREDWGPALAELVRVVAERGLEYYYSY